MCKLGTVGIPGLDTVIQPGVSSGDSNPPSNYVQGSSSTGTAEDDAFSQAESSIKNGEIVASAQGTKDGGTAQTQVQGTYSGTGTFSASAQTADKDRSAQAQVRFFIYFKIFQQKIQIKIIKSIYISITITG